MDDIVWIREDVPPKKNEDIGSRVGVEECNKGNNVKNESKKTSGAEFDINDYERTLESNVQEAINLVSDLCDRSSKVQKNQEDLLQSLEKERKERQKVEEEMRHVLLQNKRLEEEKHRLESEVSCLKFRLNGGANLEPEEAEVILNDGCIEVGGAGRMSGSERLLEEPNGAVLLPNMTLIVSDQKKGIFHLSLTSNLLRNISNSNWKWIQAPAVTKGDHPEIMVSVIAKEDGSSKWERFIFKFNENLQFIAKVKGPKWVAEYSVTRDRISIAADGYIYLMVTNTTFTALYQLSPDCKWTELCHRKDVCFLDLQVISFPPLSLTIR
ncbi:hypothetical protein AB6A40_005865 [Gnathostoma spinigerum]|uniref:Uncharacterized protein n=1 Tax=Gnathostoma spinigerum TaxID=75299 RepID=A0ABD6EIS1_9BILA